MKSPYARILRMIALLSVVSGAMVAAMVVSMRGRPAYDLSDPDYAAYSEVLAGLREKFAAGSLAGTVLDLSRINGGAWSTACLFGGYTDPVGTLLSEGAEVTPADRERLPGSGSGVRIAAVEEYEVVIAYVDPANRAHFIHFEEGLGAEGQHLRKCARKPQTSVLLDGRVSAGASRPLEPAGQAASALRRSSSRDSQARAWVTMVSRSS